MNEKLSDPPMTLVTQEMWDRAVAEQESLCGYRDAFYEIAKLLDLPAMPVSPERAFEAIMLPRLRALIARETEGQQK